MAEMNLARLQDEAGTRIRNSAITDAQWNVWLNDAQSEIASKIDLAHLEHETTFATVSATRVYYLDEFLPNSILSVVDQTNNQNLSIIDEKRIELIDQDKDDSGSPFHYSLLGTSNVEGQPSSASVVTVSSASASDTTQRVRIRGLVSSVANYELLSLNGTSSVAGTLSFSSVTHITKDAVTVGRISATSNAAAVTLALIPRARFSVEYQKIGLWPVPSGAYTIMVRGLRRPLDLVNSEDIPDLPELFHELVLIGALIRGHQFLYDFQRSNELQALFNLRIEDLKKKQANKFEMINRLDGRPPKILRTRTYGRLPPEYS